MHATSMSPIRRLIRDALDLRQINADPERCACARPCSLGVHDLVLCFGLIYHLENPLARCAWRAR
jgi:tRNA (mo5U34)-methyltransferase